VFTALGCRDVARIDFRMDDKGKIYFLECNPLPGLTPGWSDLCLISQAAGMDYRTLIGEILAGAVRRYKERERERREGARSEPGAQPKNELKPPEEKKPEPQASATPTAPAANGGNGVQLPREEA
jgi:D-alanine-D-alanine ligase